MTHQIQTASPLFVLGVPRSGTTMLARLLNSHPNVIQTYEAAPFLVFGFMVNNAKLSAVEPAHPILHGKEYQNLWAAQLETSARDVIEAFYEQVRLQEHKEHIVYWGDKHPHNNAYLPMINRLYPRARYIYIVRDPRDVACSIKEMEQIDIEQVLAIWQEISGDYERFQSTKPAEQLYLARYEDIVADYVGEMTRLMQWLELPCEASFIETVRRRQGEDFHRPDKASTFDFSKRSVARWQRCLSADEAQQVATRASDYMVKYGYAAEGLEGSSSSWGRLKKHLSSR
jgi:hypothetical protein